ncbi:hypothetical protein VNO77_21372 [Canavalia gladiata]|uniref:Uncharacterized protein n=1 Tax=Canavalia gladiata TaxID=3824 RepID=A0AAN9LV45_CANGL
MNMVEIPLFLSNESSPSSAVSSLSIYIKSWKTRRSASSSIDTARILATPQVPPQTAKEWLRAEDRVLSLNRLRSDCRCVLFRGFVWLIGICLTRIWLDSNFRISVFSS